MENRKQIVAGNWKMHKTYDEGMALVNEIISKTHEGNVQVVLGVPFIHLKGAADLTANIPYISLASQNCHEKESGAYTGEVSADMLLSVGAEYVILGHSERREHFKESNEVLSKKAEHAIS